MSSSGTARGATPPSYAGTSRNAWNPAASTYNLKASNTLKLRRALNRAAAGTGLANIGVLFSDSGATGYNGATTIEANAWPAAMASQLASMLGTTVAGSGVVPSAADTAGRISDRWSYAGGVSSSGFPYLYGFGAGTCGYTSRQAGTTVGVFYFDNGSGNITFTVDGGSVQTIVVGNTAAVKLQTVTGLANTVHTLAITQPATSVVAGAIVAGQTTGITLHNLSFGGSCAIYGGATPATTSWSDTTGYYSLAAERLAMLTLAGVTLDVVIIEVGVNDLVSGILPAVITAAIANLRALQPAADVILVHSFDSPLDGSGLFPALGGARYALADSLDCPLIDWNDVIGGYATALAAGQLGADNAHPSPSTSIGFGKTVANVLAAA